jgi:hypothetical protein
MKCLPNTESYDVIIIGCGPAGIFSALELVENTGLRILMLEKGSDLDERLSSKASGSTDYLSGWGGAGAFSDGKLTMSQSVGGFLSDYVPLPELEKLTRHVDNLYLRFGAPHRLYGIDEDKIGEIERKAALAGMKLIRNKIRHLGSENCLRVLGQIRDFLRNRLEIRTRTEAARLIIKEGHVEGVETKTAEKLSSKYIIAAPGRVGAEWLTKQARTLGLETLQNPVDLGVRVEVPTPVMEPLTTILYEPKFIFTSKTFDDPVRIFCLCPGGEVITETYNDVVTVNGHSYEDRKTRNTNFAILVSTTFTEPFKEPIAYGKHIARLANLLSGGILVQRLGDLDVGRRSTRKRLERNLVEPTLKNATPGDLSFVLPYRYLVDVKEMLKAIDQVAPGVYEKHTLLYGVEAKFYSSRMELNSSLETKVQNLFAIGDGAGVTRGLMQASISGIIAAKEIARKEGCI